MLWIRWCWFLSEQLNYPHCRTGLKDLEEFKIKTCIYCIVYFFLGIIIITIYMGMEQWSFLDTTQMFWGSNLKCQQESSEAETLDKSYSLGPHTCMKWKWKHSIKQLAFTFQINDNFRHSYSGYGCCLFKCFFRPTAVIALKLQRSHSNFFFFSCSDSFNSSRYCWCEIFACWRSPSVNLTWHYLSILVASF